MNDETQNLPDSKGRISIWLAVSLAVNALLLGLVGGRMLVGDDHDRDRPGNRPPPIESRNIPGLTKEARKDLRRSMFRMWRESRDEREEVKQARRVLLDAVLVEPFDEDAVRGALEAMREAEEKMRLNAHTALVEAIGELPPETRQSIVSRLSAMSDRAISMGNKRPPGMPPRRFGPDGPRPGSEDGPRPNRE